MDEELNLKPVTENVEQAIIEALQRGASDLVGPEDYIFSTPVIISLIGLTVFTFLLVRKTQNSLLQKIVIFLTCHFLITGEYDYFYTIPLPGFELQPARLLFLSFLGIMFIDTYLSRKQPLGQNQVTFAWNEFFLTLYIFYNILSQFFHIHELELSDIIVTDMYQLYILVIVIALKRYTNKDLIRLVGISMIVGAVFTSIVSILQFVIDPLFMRIGDYRIAFTPFLRANGSFTNEYFNAYFIIAAFAWSAIVIKNIWFRHTLMALFIVAIFLSFQRMSWIILILVFTFYFFKVLNIRYEVIAFMGLAASIALICIALIFSREIMNSSIVTHRLSEKPDGRLGYWGMVLKNIGKSPYWGYGGTQTKTYYEEMLKVTRSRARAAATEGDLHSGYMTSMFYYGIPSFVFFILFVISNLIYFLKLLPKHRFFIIVFLMALMYMIANLSNTLLFDKYLSMLLAIHMGIGMGAKKNPEILSVFDEEIPHVNQKQNSNTDQRTKEQYEFN